MNQAIVKAYANKLGVEQGRRVPLYKAEMEIIRILQAVARGLSSAFVFGYHTRTDIEQQAVLYGLEVLDSTRADTGEPMYDVSRPLENFLYTHIRNRLSNFKRDNYIRLEPPCSCCDPFNPPPSPCAKWHNWHARNFAKQNLMRPLDVSSVSDDGERTMSLPSAVETEALGNELEVLIDRSLPVELRADYQRMRGNVLIPKARRQRVREAVATIARQAGYLDDSETDEGGFDADEA